MCVLCCRIDTAALIVSEREMMGTSERGTLTEEMIKESRPRLHHEAMVLRALPSRQRAEQTINHYTVRPVVYCVVLLMIVEKCRYSRFVARKCRGYALLAYFNHGGFQRELGN